MEPGNAPRTLLSAVRCDATTLKLCFSHVGDQGSRQWFSTLDKTPSLNFVFLSVFDIEVCLCTQDQGHRRNTRSGTDAR